MLRIYAETLDRLRVRLNMYLVFRAKAKFSGQKPAAKNEKKTFLCIFLYLLNEKNLIHSVERDTVPEIRDFY